MHYLCATLLYYSVCAAFYHPSQHVTCLPVAFFLVTFLSSSYFPPPFPPPSLLSPFLPCVVNSCLPFPYILHALYMCMQTFPIPNFPTFPTLPHPSQIKWFCCIYAALPPFAGCSCHAFYHFFTYMPPYALPLRHLGMILCVTKRLWNRFLCCGQLIRCIPLTTTYIFNSVVVLPTQPSSTFVVHSCPSQHWFTMYGGLDLGSCCCIPDPHSIPLSFPHPSSPSWPSLTPLSL